MSKNYSEINVFLPKKLEEEVRPLWQEEFGLKGRTRWIQKAIDEFFSREVCQVLLGLQYVDASTEALHIAMDWLNLGLYDSSAQGSSSKLRITNESQEKILDLIKKLKKAPIKATPHTLNKACLVRTAMEQSIAGV